MVVEPPGANHCSADSVRHHTKSVGNLMELKHLLQVERPGALNSFELAIVIALQPIPPKRSASELWVGFGDEAGVTKCGLNCAPGAEASSKL